MVYEIDVKMQVRSYLLKIKLIQRSKPIEYPLFHLESIQFFLKYS